MVRLLRIYLLGCVGIAFAYLLFHVREPLRLNVGDPWLDANAVTSIEYVKQQGFTVDPIDVDPMVPLAYRPTHHPPLAEIIYGAMGKLGADDVATFRLFALAAAALAMWLLFQYVRRIWSDMVALLATALYGTSVLWLMYADSLQGPPGIHVSWLLALWGLVRAIETRARRHEAAAIAGSFACLLVGGDDWMYLLAGVLFTVHVKVGNPFARGNRRFVALCAAGCLAALATRGLLGIGPVEWEPGLIEWPAAIDHRLSSSTATVIRRITLAFTPMFWIALAYTAWRTLRAPSVRWVVEDGMAGIAAVAVIALYVSSRRTETPLFWAQPLLPFYALGSAILIARFLDGGWGRRAIAVAWVGIAPVWAFAVMLSHPRSVLDRDEVATVRAYFATSDRNDFVMSNLMADGPIRSAFARRSWPAPEADDEFNKHPMRLRMLDLLEVTGTDYVHAVIFTTPESRFIDRSLAQLLMRRRLASVTGWPYMVRAKANEIIRDYDRRVVKHLEAVGARRVLHLSNFDVYRIDREGVLQVIGQSIPAVREIDLSSLGSSKYKLLGWGPPTVTAEEHLGASSIEGYAACQNPTERRAGELAINACATVLTGAGVQVLDGSIVGRAQLIVRVERACDLRVTLELASSSALWRLPLRVASATLIGMSINDFTASQCSPASKVSFVVPARSVRPGVNVITLEKKRFGPLEPRADVMSLAIEPMCGAAIEEAAPR